MKLTGEIFMIAWGVNPSQPRFQIQSEQWVGGSVNPLKVTQIVREAVADGKFEYHIECVMKDEKGVLGSPFIWKTYIKEPDEICYHRPDEKHNYLKV